MSPLSGFWDILSGNLPSEVIDHIRRTKKPDWLLKKAPIRQQVK